MSQRDFWVKSRSWLRVDLSWFAGRRRVWLEWKQQKGKQEEEAEPEGVSHDKDFGSYSE